MTTHWCNDKGRYTWFFYIIKFSLGRFLVFGLGIPEIIIIAVILLLLFGGKRLPEIGKSLGKTVSEFRKITKEIRNEKTPTNQTQEDQQQKSETIKALQNKLVKKVTEQIPGVKDVKNIKGKTDKIKGVLK